MKKKDRLVIEDALSSNPLLLRDLPGIEHIAWSYLPLSIGIEIECHFKNTFNIDKFGGIKGIMSVSTSSEEIKIRIAGGYSGLVGLHEACTILKQDCLYTDSGNHYHVDFTGYMELLTPDQISKNESWILNELDSWGYDGTYNARDFRDGKFGWIGKRREFNTLEIRIGEMTFEYDMIYKRITHACEIITKLKKLITQRKQVKSLEDLLKNIESEEEAINTFKIKQRNLTEVDMQKTINNRVVKWQS